MIVQLIKLDRKSSQANFVATDSTGNVKIQMYFSDEEVEKVTVIKNLKHLDWVRVVGHARHSQADGTYVSAQIIAPVTDLDEIAFHIMDSVHAAKKIQSV